MWKPTTRVQSIAGSATRLARTSFWLGAAAKTTPRQAGLGLPRRDRPRHLAGRGATGLGAVLVDDDLERFDGEPRDGFGIVLGEAHCRDLDVGGFGAIVVRQE